MNAFLHVLEGGLQTTIQDGGRTGFLALGVPRGGALDDLSFRLANRLAGNPPGTAVLELRSPGPVLRVDAASARIVLTGSGQGLVIERGGEARHWASWRAIDVGRGDILRIVPFADTAVAYLAVAGGFDVPEVLGSRSTDTLSNTGPSPVRAGDSLLVGAMSGPLPDEEQFPPPPPMDDPVEIRVRPGPRDDWFTPGSLRALFHETWTVTSELDRVGIRFHGPGRLHRARHEEMPSEGMVPGSLQIPPDGHPVLFLVDHPVTGGYPVAAVAVAADLPVAAQLRPGQRVRFVPVR